MFRCINRHQTEQPNVVDLDWLFGYQSANPTEIAADNATENTPIVRTYRCHTNAGRNRTLRALQLAIRRSEMLTAVNQCLIGVVLFQWLAHV